MVATVIPYSRMAHATHKRLTVDLPEDLHEAFLRKCFNAKPRTNMKRRIIELISKDTGRPVPEFVDLRKMTKEEREEWDRKHG